MKPRTKLQRRIVAASGRLPEITPAQLHWGYAHLLPQELMNNVSHAMWRWAAMA